MFDEVLVSEAKNLLEMCNRAGLCIATAESCTGGLLAGLLTDIPGSSSVFERGFVTYSNEAKIELLNVNAHVIEVHGAVSELVSLEMAEGAIAHSAADLSVSVTGIAGPGGGSEDKPVGLVHFGCARKGRPTIHDQEIFSGSRHIIRMDAIRHALRLLQSQID